LSSYAARHLSRASVAEVLQTIALPVLVTPVDPAPEQKAPGVTVAGAAGLVVVATFAAVVFGAAAVVFGAAAVVFAGAAALVAGATVAVAAGAVVAGGSVVAATLTEAGAGGGVAVAGLADVALGVVVATVGLADELTLALGSFGTWVAGVEVSGFAIAPTAPRLMTPPATMPILTFPLSAFQAPLRPGASLGGGIRYGRGGCGLFMLGGWVMRSLHLGPCSGF
jgi:hypothetical protein